MENIHRACDIDLIRTAPRRPARETGLGRNGRQLRLDNACKWADHHVGIGAVEVERAGSRFRRRSCASPSMTTVTDCPMTNGARSPVDAGGRRDQAGSFGPQPRSVVVDLAALLAAAAWTPSKAPITGGPCTSRCRPAIKFP